MPGRHLAVDAEFHCPTCRRSGSLLIDEVMVQALASLPDSASHCTVKETGEVVGVEEGDQDVALVTLGDSPYLTLPSASEAKTPSWPNVVFLAPRNFFTFPSPSNAG